MHVRRCKSLDEKCSIINAVTGIYISIICKCLKAVESKELIKEDVLAGEVIRLVSVGDQEMTSSLTSKNVFQ